MRDDDFPADLSYCDGLDIAPLEEPERPAWRGPAREADPDEQLLEARRRVAVRVMMIVPARYRRASASDETALAWIKEPHDVLYITGPTGTGKTHLAWGLIRQYIAHTHGVFRRPDKIPACKGWTVTELGNEIKTEWNAREIEGPSTLDKACRTTLLLLDDVGAERQTDWNLEQMDLVVNSRYNNLLPTIVTTNVPPKGLAERLGDRVASRVAENATIIALTGDDRRRS